jgi:hypothetical protein
MEREVFGGGQPCGLAAAKKEMVYMKVKDGFWL